MNKYFTFLIFLILSCKLIAQGPTTDAPKCPNSDIHLYSNTSGPWQWNGPNGFNSTQPDPIIQSATMADTGMYQLISNFIDTFFVRVTLFDYPVADFSIQGGCVNDSVHFINNSYCSTNPITSWFWDFGLNNWNYSSTDENPVFKYDTCGTYTVVLVVTTGSGCVSLQLKPLKINCLPSVNAGNDSIICSGNSITLNGNGALSCVWNNSNSLDDSTSCSPLASPIITTSYILSTNDTNGCIGMDTVTIYVDDLNVSINGSDTLCSGNCTTLNADVNNDTNVLSYYWNDGTVDSLLQICSTGNYSVLVTDVYGCAMTDSITITVLDPQIAISTNSPICENDTLFMACNVSYGLPPYSYIWTGPGINTLSVPSVEIANANLANSGNYYLKVTDSFGCVDTTTLSIQVNSNPVAQLTMLNLICQDDTIKLFGSALNGFGPYIHNSYIEIINPDTLVYLHVPASNNDTTSLLEFSLNSHINSYIGKYIVTDANGCKDSVLSVGNMINDCVFPGDANYDMIANNMDLLNIGLAYGNTGATRNSASIDWDGQACSNWPQQFIDSVNFKHADCNGDGLVNAIDTIAIIMNYSQQHFKSNNVSTTGPLLAINIPSGTYQFGMPFLASITLGDSTASADNVYGIAFTLSYPTNAIDDLSSFISFSNSWLGTDLLKLYHKNNDYTVDISICRKDHLPISGNGEICRFQGNTNALITGKIDSIFYGVFEISRVRIIDETGMEISYSTKNDSVLINSVAVKNNFNNKSIIVFPNPANSTLYVQSDLTLTKIEIRNLTGELVMQENNIGNSRHKLDIGSLAKTVYVVTCVDVNNNISHIKVVKQ